MMGSKRSKVFTIRSNVIMFPPMVARWSELYPGMNLPQVSQEEHYTPAKNKSEVSKG